MQQKRAHLRSFARQCYEVKLQNILGSPSGELPRGLRGQHYGISNIVQWPLACPYCLRHFPRRGKQVITALTISLINSITPKGMPIA